MFDDGSWCRGHPSTRSATLSGGRWRWRTEPVITAFRHMTFENKKQQRMIDVPVAATPVLLRDESIVVASEDGYLRRFDSMLGETLWSIRINARLYASPTYCASRGMLIAVSTKGHILAVEENGKLLWTTEVGNCIYNSAALCTHSGLVFISTFEHNLFALDLETGALRWTAKLPLPWGVAFGAPAGFRDPYAAPALDFQGGCVQGSAEHLSRFDSNGRLVWTLDLGHTVRATAAISRVYSVGLVGAVNGEVLAFDIHSGKITCKYEMEGRLMNSPAISGDRGCIGTSAGEVLCVDLESGDEVWRTRMYGGLDHGSITWTPAGDFVMVLSNGNAVCISRDDGKFLWETSQVLELPLHRREIHQTPVISGCGKMLANSYNGYVYLFQFRPEAKEKYQ